MHITTLGLSTELMIRRWSGEVLDRGDHQLVHTPDEPDFWMGNGLAVPPPARGEDPEAWFARWWGAFERALPGCEHRALLVDGDVDAATAGAVTAAGWLMHRNVALTTVDLATAPAPPGLLLRARDGERDWEQVAPLHLTSDEAEATPWNAGLPIDDSYRAFVRTRAAAKRAWVERGYGAWWGAFAGRSLMATLGIVSDHGGTVARYQDVVTHPACQRRGIARALVVAAGKAALASGAERLVIVAHEKSDALRLYRATGFVDADVYTELIRRPG